MPLDAADGGVYAEGLVAIVDAVLRLSEVDERDCCERKAVGLV